MAEYNMVTLSQNIAKKVMQELRDNGLFVSRWIPVSERVPEFRKEVLTCSNGGFIEIQSLEDSYGGYWENQKGDWSDFDEIIAWMPLPEPYKAKSEEQA